MVKILGVWLEGEKQYTRRRLGGMKAVPALQMEDKSTTHAPFGPTFVPEQHHEQVAFDAIKQNNRNQVCGQT